MLLRVRAEATSEYDIVVAILPFEQADTSDLSKIRKFSELFCESLKDSANAVVIDTNRYQPVRILSPGWRNAVLTKQLHSNL
jgi:hypothetical protein